MNEITKDFHPKGFYILVAVVVGLVTWYLLYKFYLILLSTSATTNQEVPRGLEVSDIESFPKFAYSESDSDMNMKMMGECAVCLGVFEENETLRLLPRCGHVFHAECVDTWLRSHATCPFCRDNLLPDNPPSEMPTRLEVVININYQGIEYLSH